MTHSSNESLQSRVRQLEQELASITSSRSWRWTEYLRRWANLFRKLIGTPQPGAGAPPLAEDPPPAQDPPADTRTDAKSRFTTLADAFLQEFLASGHRMRLETSDAPLVSIILVVWNRAELTLQCIRSIAELRNPPFELLVVDNNSTDQAPELLSRIEGARHIRNDRNVYFVPAVNQAANIARGKYLLLLNSDAILLPGALETSVETLESADDIGAVGGKIVLLDGSLQEAGNIVWRDGSCTGYGRGEDPRAPAFMFRRDVDYCSGAFLLTRRDVFERMNGLHEIFKPIYYEETDYCLRLRDAGYRTVYEPRSVVLHYEFGSSTPENAAEKQGRNQKIFADRHRERLQQHSSAGPEHVLENRDADRTRKRVLVIDDRIPHPHLGSGFPRANRILKRLVDWGFSVTLYPLAVISEEWERVYQDIPREVEVMLEWGESNLESFLTQRLGFYDTIMVSRPHNMVRMRQVIDRNPDLVSDAALVYDAEALFSFREAKQLELKGLAGANELETRVEAEVDLARVADSIISVSPREAGEFLNRGIESVHVLGHAHDVGETEPAFSGRTGFLFVGAIHETDTPNGDSILWFVKEILPRIRESDPTAFLSVVGVINSREVSALASDCVRILGPADDLRTHYEQARVFIAPTRFAAGLPHKVTEAAAQGIPVVATSLLAEQLAWHDEQELLVGDTPDQFARQCLRLNTDSNEWNRIRGNALAKVREECSADRFDRTLHKLMESSAEQARRRRVPV